MRIRLINIILCISLIAVFSCEEEFEPNIESSGESLIVVDGLISNLPGPYTVKLSMSSKIENPKYIPLSGFSVAIIDNLEQIVQLVETESGKYVTFDNSFKGVIGRKYKLQIMSPMGEFYESSYEELREPTTIESIDHKLEYTVDEDLIYDIAGYRFYLNSLQAPVDSNYYMWQLERTYKYSADFKIYWIYEGSLKPVTNYDTLRYCYKTDILPEIYLLNTEHLAPPLVSKFPLNYVTTQTRELMLRYSLLVRQFSMSKESYKFWQIIKDQNTNLGNLYSKQPFQVRGNIYNTNNQDEIVLGQFMVAGITEKRIFVDRPDPTIKMRYPICGDPEWIFENFRYFSDYPSSSWPIFGTKVNGGNALPNQWCMDCRKSGGIIEKPDFWID